MKKFGIVAAVVVGVVSFSPNLLAQTAAKPSAYSGVSQPPPDETITTDDAEVASPAKLVVRPVVAPAAVVSAPAVAETTAGAATPAKWNLDYGMIGDSAPGTASVPTAQRVQSSANPDADIVMFVPSRPGELPEGTIIRMALNEEISTGQSQPGSDFTGRVASDVLSAGRVVIPQGSEVVGKVLRVTEGHRFGTAATIRLRPDVIVLPDGTRYVMRAQIVDTSGKSRVDGEGTLKPKSRAKTNVIKESAGIGTGAVAGALVGGAPGALVGSLIGAGVMTTNILVQHPASVKVPKDSTLTLSLTQPMSITPAPQTN